MVEAQPAESGAYIFDASWKQERERLGHLEAVWDPETIPHLESVGVGEGWHCAEIGAGTGSIAEWLSRQVGATGHVVTTDIETKCSVPKVPGPMDPAMTSR